MTQSVDQLEKELDDVVAQAGQILAQAADASIVEAVRVKYLGRQGMLNGYFANLRSGRFSPQEKARLGQKLNESKRRLEQAITHRRQEVASAGPEPGQMEDVTLPGHPPDVARLHPITQTVDQITAIFRSLGFSVVEGPEVETEHYNFEALNIPPGHPSRENFDTFYLSEDEPLLLRSHTSPVQVRFMERHNPPFQIIVPGRVFRRDAVDATHCFQFHQVEGLAVVGGVTFGDLKGILAAWARGMFGPAARLRFRSHYFPFTEPSAEADLHCIFCGGNGCRICGHKGWLEILGCGMVHPAVFKAAHYSPGMTGFAFGMGVERIAMLKYRVQDIRLFFENDLRFLNQFA